MNVVSLAKLRFIETNQINGHPQSYIVFVTDVICYHTLKRLKYLNIGIRSQFFIDITQDCFDMKYADML